MAVHHLPGAGMADPDAHPAIVLADMLVERTYAVVAGGAAAGLDPDLARGEFDLVVEHGHRRWFELVETQGLADGLPGQVHEGLRLDQQHLLAADPAFGDLGPE